MTWPPDPDALGAITIDVTPVIGGTPGDFLKVGATGKLEQAPLSDIGVDIGSPVGSGVPGAVLFIDAAGDLAQDPGFFDYDKAAGAHLLKRKGVADDNTVLEQWTPGNAGAPIYTEKLGGASFFGTWDPVVYRGFNQEGQNAAHGRIAEQMEGLFHYATGPDRFGQEYHLVHSLVAGADPMRFLSFLGDEANPAPPGGNGRGIGLRGDEVLFVDNQDDTKTASLRGGNFFVEGGGSFVVGGNNIPALLQLNAAHDNYLELLMLDSANHGRLFRQLSDWYGNANVPGGAMRAGLVNDADNSTANAASFWLLPIGGTPGYSVAGVLEAYNPGDSTNTTGLRFKRKDGTSLYTALDIGLNGSVAVNPATGQSEALLDLSAGADAIPRVKAILTADSVNPLDVAGYIKVRIGSTDHYIQVVNASA